MREYREDPVLVFGEFMGMYAYFYFTANINIHAQGRLKAVRRLGEVMLVILVESLTWT